MNCGQRTDCGCCAGELLKLFLELPVVTAVQQEKVSLTTVQQVAVRFAMRRHEEFLIPEGVNLIWLSGSLRCGNIGPPGLGERQSGRLVR